jgi:hypothetical protein
MGTREDPWGLHPPSAAWMGPHFPRPSPPSKPKKKNNAGFNRLFEANSGRPLPPRVGRWDPISIGATLKRCRDSSKRSSDTGQHQVFMTVMVAPVVVQHQATEPTPSHHPRTHCTVAVAPSPPRGPLVGGPCRTFSGTYEALWQCWQVGHEGSARGGQPVAYTGRRRRPIPVRPDPPPSRLRPFGPLPYSARPSGTSHAVSLGPARGRRRRPLPWPSRATAMLDTSS